MEKKKRRMMEEESPPSGGINIVLAYSAQSLVKSTLQVLCLCYDTATKTMVLEICIHFPITFSRPTSLKFNNFDKFLKKDRFGDTSEYSCECR